MSMGCPQLGEEGILVHVGSLLSEGNSPEKGAAMSQEQTSFTPAGDRGIGTIKGTNGVPYR